MSTRKKLRIRRIIQIIFFLLIALITLNRTLAESGKSLPFISTASLHALCPFGGVATIYEMFTAGTILRQIQLSSIVLMIIIFVSAFLFGPLFCGWVCPLGTFQEWLGSIGRRIFKKRYNRFVPSDIDRILRYLRYAVLVWVLYVIAKTASIAVFKDIDPYSTLFNFWTGEAAAGGIIVLLLTVVLSLFIERPWCKYACPYGALLGITNLIRIFPIKRSAQTCISCGRCDRDCPMNIKVSEKGTVRDHQCITCLRCTSEESCPVSTACSPALSLAGNKTAFRVNSKITAAALVFILFGGIALADNMGYWKTSSSRSFLNRNNYLSQESHSEEETGEEETGEEETGITGSTTFKEALEMGLTEQQIEEVMGEKIPDINMVIKDYVHSRGLSFGIIKKALAEKLP